MSFDWVEYLDLAEELAGYPVNPASQEAKLRSSISRAYYAAFSKARNYLRDIEGLSLSGTGEDHRRVREEFKNSPDRVRKKIGNDVDHLRTSRTKYCTASQESDTN